MNKEIRSFFNLTRIPFHKEIPADSIQLLPKVDSYLASLETLVETRGIGMITGKSGTGKSCLLRLLTGRLHTGLYKSVYICHSTAGILEFYIQLCNGFGLIPVGRKTTMLKNIKEHILTLNTSHRIQPVLLIDEAHLLSNDILQEIRILTNFEIDSFNALTVIFCGQELFRQKLSLSNLESLANSITMNITVDTLAKEEAFAYIEKRMTESGAVTPVFTRNALTLIHQASAGVFRVINNIANAALSKAFYQKSSTVEAEHVKSVIER